MGGRSIHLATRWVSRSALALLLFGGCDSLLDVTRPGKLTESDLNNPEKAPSLVLGAQADFECMLGAYIWATGLWTTELHAATTDRPVIMYAIRNPDVTELGAATCDKTDPPGLWLPLNIARVQADQRQGASKVSPRTQSPTGVSCSAEHLPTPGTATCSLEKRFAPWPLMEGHVCPGLTHGDSRKIDFLPRSLLQKPRGLAG